jgi:hypothetical protein
MTLIVTTNTFDIGELQIQPPVDRTKGKYISYISYAQKTTPFYLRTPMMKIEHLDNSVISFKIDKSLGSLLKELDLNCVERISEKSAEFFKGKKFSKSKIESSFINSYQNNTVYAFISNDLKIKNQKGIDCTLDDLYTSQDAIAIFHVKGIVYKKSSIQLLISVEQLKIYVTDHLNDWCLETICDDRKPVDTEYQEYDTETDTDLSELSESSDQEQEEVPETVQETITVVPEEVPVVQETVPEEVPVVQETVPEEVPVVPETVPETVPVVPETVPETVTVVPETVPVVQEETVPETVQETVTVVLEQVPVVPETVPETVQEVVPETVQETVSETVEPVLDGGPNTYPEQSPTDGDVLRIQIPFKESPVVKKRTYKKRKETSKSKIYSLQDDDKDLF